MGQTTKTAMSYEIHRSVKSPLKPKTYDVRKLSSLSLLAVVYRRWEIEILSVVAVGSLTYAIISRF